jgi:hypothetical protein
VRRRPVRDRTGRRRGSLREQPGHAPAHFELARAYFLKGEGERALSHFERVLDSRPPPDVVDEIGLYLAFMSGHRPTETDRRWSGYLSTAISLDDNLDSASETNVIWFNFEGLRLPIPLDEEDRPQSGPGALFWVGGADAVRREHAGRRFDLSWMGLHVGPRWRLDGGIQASLFAEAERLWLAERPESDTFGLRLDASRPLTSRLGLRAAAKWRWQDARHSDAFNLDGPALEFSLTSIWEATEALLFHATLGHEIERPKTVAFRNVTLWYRLGAFTTLPGIRLGVGGGG